MRGNHMDFTRGTVYTNEPGLYEIGNFGCCAFERCVLITDNGYETLTTLPQRG